MRALSATKKSISHFLVAKDQIRKLLAIEPSYYLAFRDLGLIDLNLYDLGQFEDSRRELLVSAKSAFSSCLTLNPQEDGCYEGQGQVYFEEGQFDKAFAHYFHCLSHMPTNAACRLGIVVAFEKNAQRKGLSKIY